MRPGVAVALGVLCAAFLATGAAAEARPAFLPEGKAFGFNANLYPLDEPCCDVSQRSVETARIGGATHMRMGIVWRFYENETNPNLPKPPSFSKPVGAPSTNAQTTRADAQYLAIVNAGMTPVLYIHSAPKWASHFHTCDTNPVDRLNFTKCPPDWKTNANVLYVAQDRMYAMFSFAAAVAQRYPLAIMEGTNEPDYQQHAQARYHPPVELVADGQCALANGVRSVDPTRQVLGPGMFRMTYAEPFIKRIGLRNCYDAFNLHMYGYSEVRAGPSSGPKGLLTQLRYFLNRDSGGDPIFLTETGLSNTFPIHDNTEELGERLIARALPRWITVLLNEPDITGLLLHTLREKTFNEGGANLGFAQLDNQYRVKDPGPGVMPRWCWLVLQNGEQYPGCESWTLPPVVPAAPTWFKALEALWPSNDASTQRVARLLFFEEGHPLPHVGVIWYRCNSIGLGCLVAARDTSNYVITDADRYKTLKATVVVQNEHGQLVSHTELSPLIT